MREKLFLMGVGIFSILLCFYRFVWQPLSEAVTDQTERYRQQIALISALQALSSSLSAGEIIPKATSDSQLLVKVEQQITGLKMEPFLKGINQMQPNRVQVQFENAPFDTIILLTEQLWKAQRVYVTELSVSKTKEPGAVTGYVILIH